MAHLSSTPKVAAALDPVAVASRLGVSLDDFRGMVSAGMRIAVPYASTPSAATAAGGAVFDYTRHTNELTAIVLRVLVRLQMALVGNERHAVVSHTLTACKTWAAFESRFQDSAGGSTDLTSDYDVTVKGAQPGRLVACFNDAFRFIAPVVASFTPAGQSRMWTWGTLYDSNVYGVSCQRRCEA